jgi:alpha-beta hydrolase superfamily lysophospholipase
MRQLKNVSFKADGYTLKGCLHLPPDSPNRPPVVIGSHGLFSSGNSPKQLALAHQCNDLGIAFFRFDHRGCGDSQGEFPHVTSLESRSNDLNSAVKTIIDLFGSDIRIGLFGSSMGGSVCLNVAAHLKISALVTYAAPLRLDATIASEDLPGLDRPQTSRHRLCFDIRDRLAGINTILIVHGDADTVVPYADALVLYQAVGHPKHLIRQRGGDHLMSRRSHQKQFIRAAADWFAGRF